MGWPTWLLIACLSLACLLLLALHLLRFRYAFAYDFPNVTEARMELSFLWWRKVLAPAAEDREPEDGMGNREVSPSGGGHPESGASPGGSGPAGPRPGQGGFLALPWKERLARFQSRFKSAALKWALDLALWGRLLAYALRSGLRALRFIGPSMEHLHVGSADVYNLGRFAAAWSSLSAAIPFLACPVAYGFNERPFALRLRASGGCTALGLLAFAVTLLITLPWLGMAGRFLSCWRNPRLNRWQRKLVAAVA